ncbi:hypothetical protein [Corynebacterium sp.]|uniref:hypothetical protein n=1 Tax=Corynebacterium sp. TaxID=1720 RepID=UPI0026DD0823|nr:hypothetical protein [Corynebacterium sp.]MDO5032752.1 hypothetical protein [Corynebacterium sp.]
MTEFFTQPSTATSSVTSSDHVLEFSPHLPAQLDELLRRPGPLAAHPGLSSAPAGSSRTAAALARLQETWFKACIESSRSEQEQLRSMRQFVGAAHTHDSQLAHSLTPSGRVPR